MHIHMCRRPIEAAVQQGAAPDRDCPRSAGASLEGLLEQYSPVNLAVRPIEANLHPLQRQGKERWKH